MHMDWNAEDKQAEAEGHPAAGIKRVPTFTSRDEFCSRARVTKYSLFSISFLAWVAGGTLVGVGIWWRLLKTWLVAFDPVLVDMAFLFIGLGVIMIVVSSFGCLGALREHVCFLKTFIFAIGVVFVAQVVLGVVAFLTLDMVEDKMLSFTRNAMSDFRKGDDSREIDDAIDYLQETYMCCGGVSFQDWEFNAAYNCSSSSPTACGVPSSCCREPSVQCGLLSRRFTESYADDLVYTRGCIGALVAIYKDNIVVIGVIAFVVGFLQIVCLVLAHQLIKYTVQGAKQITEVTMRAVLP